MSKKDLIFRPIDANNIYTVPNTNISYRVEPKMAKIVLQKWIPALQKKDEDIVIAIDGSEGAGKSTYAFQLGRLVDPNLDLSRVVFDAESFKEAVFKAEKGQCIIYDEAFTGFSSRSSLSGINRYLVSLMMQMRQKNLFIIIVLPTFFLLDKYVALFRTRALIHVFKSKGRRGVYKVYNKLKKKNLYLFGKQTYSYVPKMVKTRNRGRFPGVFALGDETVEKKYRAKKAKALEDTHQTPMSAGQIKYKEQRDIFIYLLRKHTKMSYQQMEEVALDLGVNMTYVQLSQICKKFGDNGEEIERKRQKEIERNRSEQKHDENGDFDDQTPGTDSNSDGDELEL